MRKQNSLIMGLFCLVGMGIVLAFSGCATRGAMNRYGDEQYVAGSQALIKDIDELNAKLRSCEQEKETYKRRSDGLQRLFSDSIKAQSEASTDK